MELSVDLLPPLLHVTYESQKQKPKENTVKRTVDSSLASQMERLQFPNAKTERYFVKYGINSGSSGIGLCIISQRKIKLKKTLIQWRLRNVSPVHILFIKEKNSTNGNESRHIVRNY